MDTDTGKMTVKYIPDEDDSLEEKMPVVNKIGYLKVREEKNESADPFVKSAGDLKGYRGVDANFKRRVTGALKKVNASADGEVRSKQIEGEAWTGYDAFEVVSPPYNLDALGALYERSAPHHAAVEAKIANIVGLGYKFVETPKTKRVLEEQASGADDKSAKKLAKTRRALDEHRDEMADLFESFHGDDTFIETLTKVWRDYEVMGNGYLEIGRKRDGQIGYVGHIPAQTMRVRREHDGYVQISGNKIQYFGNLGDGINKENGQPKPIRNPIGNDVSPHEVLHIKNHVPTSTYYGVPDIVAAMQAIASNDFVAKFNLDYFEHKAVPRHLIILKGANLGDTAQARLLEFFESNLKGSAGNGRSLFIPLPGGTKENQVDFSIEPIEAGVQEASFLNMRKVNDKDIYTVHRVPETKVSVSGGVNIAVAKDADKTFKEQVCGPLQDILEMKLNRIVKEFTDALEISLNEMTLTDEDTQSKIEERRVKTGTETANEQRIRRGQPGHKDGDQLVDLNAKDKIAQQQAELTTQRERDATRSAGATDSNGASRNAKGEGRTTA